MKKQNSKHMLQRQEILKLWSLNIILGDLRIFFKIEIETHIIKVKIKKKL